MTRTTWAEQLADNSALLCYSSGMTRDSEIDREIFSRNILRRAAGLPPLTGQERDRLLSARAVNIFDAVFAVERIRFESEWKENQDGFFANWGRWSKARQQVAAELQMGKHAEYVLRDLGYRLVDDSWSTDGRKTYAHDDDADRVFLTDLEMTLAVYGWKKNARKLRTFLNESTGELIEIEPGGAETSGHFLHHLKGG